MLLPGREEGSPCFAAMMVPAFPRKAVPCVLLVRQGMGGGEGLGWGRQGTVRGTFIEQKMREGIVTVVGEGENGTAFELLAVPRPLSCGSGSACCGVSYDRIGYHNVMETTSSLHSFGVCVVVWVFSLIA